MYICIPPWGRASNDIQIMYAIFAINKKEHHIFDSDNIEFKLKYESSDNQYARI